MPSRCQLCSALELRSKDMLATELISRRKTRARVRVSQVVLGEERNRKRGC